MDLSTVLSYYNREDIQTAIVNAAHDREVAVRFGQGGFGKRPDILNYPKDVIELVKQGATSFHVSEEIWRNPLAIESSMKPRELDELRTGWDLVLDIDCPDWEFSKLTAHMFIKALKEQGIKSISCKFSGNKGFHIGVPFEAFPSVYNGKPLSESFPEGPQKIASFLLDFVDKNYVKVIGDRIVFDAHSFTIPQLREKFDGKDFISITCSSCGKKLALNTEKNNEFVCSKCGKNAKSRNNFLECGKCKVLMNQVSLGTSLCSCGSNDYHHKFDPLAIIEVDTILIAPRHLYRMPYSLHEKSGLASIPIDPSKVLEFDKSSANPESLKISEYRFLDNSNAKPNEAKKLLVKASDFLHKEDEKIIEKTKEYNVPETAIPSACFPPCIHNILKGIKDGRKRAVFILKNFLSSCGWGNDEIEKLIYDWNRKNPDSLKETIIKGQLSHHRKLQKRFPPPNCDNQMYYQAFGVCTPDNLCSKIRNPVNYSIRKARYVNGRQKDAPKTKPKKGLQEAKRK